MKHILPILTAAFVCMGAYTATAQDTTSEPAAFTYEVLPTPYTNQVNQGTDWQYYVIKITGGTGKLYVVDYLNYISADSDQQNESIGKNISRYGWYDASNKVLTDPLKESDVHWSTVNDDNRSSAGTFTDLYNSSNTTEYTRYRYELAGNFKEGDIIGIAMERNGQIVGSYDANSGTNSTRYGNSVDAYANAKFGGWNDDSRKYLPVAELTFTGQNLPGSNSPQFRYLLQAEGVAASNEGGDDNNNGGPVGSPLPGGLQIALIAGLFGLGFWYVRRRKSFAA